MTTKANIVMISGTQLLGTARNHTVVTDRPPEDGGTDTGFTSGEMLLLAVGSCVSGSVRRHFAERGTPCRDLSVDICFDSPVAAGKRDRIVIDLQFDAALCADAERIRTVALSGGVTSRLAAGSDMEVRINGKPPGSAQRDPALKSQ